MRRDIQRLATCGVLVEFWRACDKSCVRKNESHRRGTEHSRLWPHLVQFCDLRPKWRTQHRRNKRCDKSPVMYCRDLYDSFPGWGAVVNSARAIYRKANLLFLEKPKLYHPHPSVSAKSGVKSVAIFVIWNPTSCRFWFPKMSATNRWPTGVITSEILTISPRLTQFEIAISCISVM